MSIFCDTLSSVYNELQISINLKLGRFFMIRQRFPLQIIFHSLFLSLALMPLLSLSSSVSANDEFPCDDDVTVLASSAESLAKDIQSIQTQFQQDHLHELQLEKNPLYPISMKDLSLGKIQIHTQIVEKPKFLKQNPHVKALDGQFYDYLDSKKYDYVFHTRYAYIIPNVSVDQFTSDLYRNETYTKMAHPKDTFGFPDKSEGSSGGQNSEAFSWVVEQKIPFLDDIKSKVRYQYLLRSEQEAQLSPTQKEHVAINTSSLPAPLITIQHVAKAHTPNGPKKSIALGKEHDYIKSSFILTQYVPVGPEGKDLLLIVSQFSTLNKPFYVPASSITGGTKDFNDNISTLVAQRRLFFSQE
jgi:hypothetical protein